VGAAIVRLSSGWAGRYVGLIGAFCLIVLCAGCTATDTDTSNASIFASLFDPDELRARQPRDTKRGSGQNGAGDGQNGGVIQFGEDTAVTQRLPAALSSPAAGEYNLNFENAALQEIVRAVLGDALGVSYTMAPDVTGTATIATGRPLSRDELLQALERVLLVNGAALEKRGDSYAVVRSGSAVAGNGRAGDPGHAMTILPLRFVSADAVMSLIDGFGTRPGAVRVQKSRNLLVIVGSREERQAAVQTAMSFDVDWMRNQSVAVFPLRRAKAEALIPELERIFKTGEESIGAETVQFTRVARLNGILVVAGNSQLLSRARVWIGKLDRSDSGLDSMIHVYRVKYRNAKGLADLLNQVFVSGASSEQAAAAETTPTQGSALSVESAFDRNMAERMGTEPAADSTVPVIFGLDSPAPLRIHADASNNSVVIYADSEKQQEILRALQQIDVPQLQVAINVTMAEIRLNDDLRYGVQYFLKSRKLGLGTDEGSIGVFNTLNNTVGRNLPGFNFLLGSEQNPDIIIDAFDSITDVQVLSSPSLVVLDNEIAQFQVGDQIPVVTRTVTGVDTATAPVSNEVVYRDTGVILKVRPRVSDNGVVNMVIEQEISAVTGGASSLTPTISNRLLSSSISVVDGQTVLLGGLISEQADGSKSGIPGLHRMKGIGGLFGRTGKANRRTEVIILIRASVIRESQDAEQVAGELREKMWGLGSRKVR
jgi:general secretion pathway protein D